MCVSAAAITVLITSNLAGRSAGQLFAAGRCEQKEGDMKYVVIARAAPGVENQRKALEVFLKAGPAPGSQGLLAGADGKTYIDFIESDEPDMVTALTYAPFFDKFEVVPVVSVDQTWLQAVQAAQANWD
jgi:hypothetical protein